MSALTQNKIAKLAKVSQASVSRVLSGDGRVDKEIRSRVLAVVAEHDYVPDARAQSLRSQRSGLLGIVAHRSPRQLERDPFFSALVASIIEFGGKHEYHLCVDAARTLSSRRSIYEELLRTRRVDGLILVEPQTQDEAIIRLMAAGFPFVLIGRYEPVEAVHSVDNDNVSAGRMATQYLLGKGYRRIAYIGGPKDLYVSRDRLHGYREALGANDIPYHPALVLHGDFSEASGFRAMQKLLDLREAPRAVVAVDDVTAVGAVRAAKERRLTIPAEMAVVGFNDSWFCPYVDPPMTSVSVDIRALAQAATEMLIELIEQCHAAPLRRIVPCRLVERSTA